MATDYGVDVAALDDLPDPEVLVEGDDNLALAQGRRLLQPADAFDEIGETAQYDCLDLRDFLGRRLSVDEQEELEADVDRVLNSDPRVRAAEGNVELAGGALKVDAATQGRDGAFNLVLTVDKVSASLLKGT
jgi:hypothetical protein